MAKKLTIVIFLLAISANAFSQVKQKESAFYFGLGTSISTFMGGDFGKRFGIRFAANDEAQFQNDNNNYYYNKYQDNSNNANNSPSLNPLQFSLTGGVNVTQFAALELQTAFMWHSNGDIADKNYQTGITNGFSYLDRNANASLLAIPLIASLKFFPLGKNNSPIFISGGYGIQFVHESVERVRDYYTPSQGYYGTYNSRVAQETIEDHSGSRWMTGYRASIGMAYKLFGALGNEVELSYSNFRNNISGDNALTINRASNIGSISLGTKIFLGL